MNKIEFLIYGGSFHMFNGTTLSRFKYQAISQSIERKAERYFASCNWRKDIKTRNIDDLLI